MKTDGGTRSIVLTFLTLVLHQLYAR